MIDEKTKSPAPAWPEVITITEVGWEKMENPHVGGGADITVDIHLR